MPNAFEEMLRHQLPLQFVGRTVTVDTEVAGVPIRAGQRVVLLLICANRDEHEFTEPESLRPAPRHGPPPRVRARRARVHRRARRPARRRRAGAGAPGALPALRGRRGRALAARCRSSTWGGPGCRSARKVVRWRHDAAHHRRRHAPHRAARRVDHPGPGAVPRRGAARRAQRRGPRRVGARRHAVQQPSGSPRSRAGPSRSPPARRPTRSATRPRTTPTRACATWTRWGSGRRCSTRTWPASAASASSRSATTSSSSCACARTTTSCATGRRPTPVACSRS